MECPKCESELVAKYYKGFMEVDSCPICRGMWLDFDELDRLEDTVFDDDVHKGSLIHREDNVNCCCPRCGGIMHEFQYRLYDLRLDFCLEGHGFWLDAGEDGKVIEIMQRRAVETKRKFDAEKEWKGVLKGMHSMLKKF